MQRTLVVLLAGGLVLWALSSPDAPSFVNITRDQYQEGHRKWQALGVREYQETVTKSGADSYCWRGCTLHIYTDGHKAEIVDPVGRPGLEGISASVPPDALQDMTIEGMFAYIDSLLPATTDVNPTAKRRAVLGGMSYTMRFNAGKGYPDSLEARLFNDRYNFTQWLGVYQWADVNWTIQVKSVMLITQVHN